MKYLLIPFFAVGLLIGVVLGHTTAPTPTFSGTQAVADVPVDEIPAAPVQTITDVAVSLDAKAPVNTLQFQVKDTNGLVYIGSKTQVDGLVNGIDANIHDLQTKRGEVVGIQTAIQAKIDELGLKDPPATTTP